MRRMLLVALCAAGVGVSAAELSVMSAGALEAGIAPVVQQFQRESGHVVAVEYGTSPELTGPGLPGAPRHRLLTCEAPCSPCFLRECPIDFRCMTGITVEQAVAAVIEAAGLNS